MKTWLKVVIGIVVVIAALILAIFILFSSISRPTKGPKIANYPQPKKALLVIDVQNDFTKDPKTHEDKFANLDIAIPRINLLQQSFRADSLEVIHISQVFSGTTGRFISKHFMGGLGVEESPGIGFDERVMSAYTAKFNKSIGDAFVNPELSQFLVEHQINELYLTGLDAEFCVHSTAKGALNRGYKVNIITDAIMTVHPDKMPALLKTYTKEGINLVTAQNVLLKK